MNSEKIEEMLIQHEGLALKPYKCPAGKLTIGVGRNIEDIGITKEEALYLLRNDIDRCHQELAKMFGHTFVFDIGEPRHAVLMDMIFNLGLSRFSKFANFIQAVKDQNWSKAALEMQDSAWYKQVGNRAKRLCKMMETGEWVGV